ncbi:hypothetical protein Bpfe_027498 [Biomphalaria pfeifferi]|uniref:Uncharacterized protein n=1 Tax=Biomphalaria pfeifferi TaxID=112525 RepID=A0AAD8AXZ4_BIOPF|nr:hypothetical protein Bpfe_027498 [Biomphalaria pfeifferi]
MVLPDMCEVGDRDDDHDIPAGPNVPSLYQLNVHIRDSNLASPENDGIIQEGLHEQESQEQEEEVQPLSQPLEEQQNNEEPVNDQEPVPHNDQEPVPHNDQEPVPHNDQEPVPHNDQEPVPHNDQEPVPHNDQEPVPQSDQATINSGHYPHILNDQTSTPVTASSNGEQFVVTIIPRKYESQRASGRDSDSQAAQGPGPNRDQVGSSEMSQLNGTQSRN